MEQASQGQMTETLHRMIFRGPLARFRSPKSQVLPPILALILEFAAFASIPLLFMGYLILSTGSSSSVSADLNGVWKTQAPNYADRFLEISDHVILFGTGGDTLESYVIERVETQPDGTKTLYTITYRDIAMTEFRLSFYYEPRGQPSMTFKHQDHLTWTRVQE